MRGITKVVIGGLIVLAVIIVAADAVNLLMHKGGPTNAHAAKVTGDSFVGTWSLDPDTRLVISQVAKGYLVVSLLRVPGGVVWTRTPNRVLFTRHGDVLLGTIHIGGKATSVTIAYEAAAHDVVYFSQAEGTWYLNQVVAPHNPPATATPSAAASTATYTSAAFHFAISYDASLLAAHIDQSISSAGQWLIPGVGRVKGPTQVLDIIVKSPASLPVSDRGEFELTAVGPIRQLQPPTLAAFSRESYLRSLASWVTSNPQAVRLNGLHAFRYSMRLTPGAFKGASFLPSPSPTAVSVTTLDYVVYHDGLVYYMNLEAPTPRWPSVEAALTATAQSFRLTP